MSSRSLFLSFRVTIKQMNKKYILVAVMAALIGLFFALGLNQYFNFEFLKEQQQNFNAVYLKNPWTVMGAFFFIYVFFTSLSLPAAGILTLASGALFGFKKGIILVSFASAIGATIAFLIIRYLFHDEFQRRFGDKLGVVNRGIERDGWLYLFSIRMVPVFPFFIVNALMALTPIRAWTFYWSSQLGMLIISAIFVNAGTQLATLTSPGDILKPEIILSLVLVAVFPIIAKFVFGKIKKRTNYGQQV